MGGEDPPPPPAAEDDAWEDLAPCASLARGKWVNALEVRFPKDDWPAFQYQHIAHKSKISADKTRFEVVFEGRDERCRVIAKGRNLNHYYLRIVQHRIEWIRAADRDFAADGKPIILSVEVVTEPVK